MDESLARQCCQLQETDVRDCNAISFLARTVFRTFRESRLGSNASQTTHVRIDENHLRLPQSSIAGEMTSPVIAPLPRRKL